MIQKKRGILQSVIYLIQLGEKARRIYYWVRCIANKMKEKSSEFALKERLLIQYADKYYPVKKYAVEIQIKKEHVYDEVT